MTHNKIHVLPTLEECRDAAKQCRREEWQRKSLNEDMLSEDIIVEIQEDCYASSRNTDSEEEKELEPISEPKSCLKKPPTVVTVTDHDNKKKKSATKKNQKKRKRSNSKSEGKVT